MEINLPLKIEMREKGRITLCDSDNRMILYNVNVCDFDRAKEFCEAINKLYTENKHISIPDHLLAEEQKLLGMIDKSNVKTPDYFLEEEQRLSAEGY